MNASVTAFGDRAVLIDVDDVVSAHRLAAAVTTAGAEPGAPAWLDETVVGHGNVVVLLTGDPVAETVVESWLARLIEGMNPRTVSSAAPKSSADHRALEIPVIFDGPDLAEVATLVDETPRSVIELLTGSELQVAFVGFAPGFPYLVGLPPELAGIPRRSTPRPSVPAGSVAVAGGFASVYPGASPGGWMLVGHTATPLFDPHRPPYALLGAGDTVRFTEQAFSDGNRFSPGPSTGSAHPTPVRAPLVNRSQRFVEVVDPGPLTLVEDAGRRGVASLGIPRAGPADPVSMRLANRLVGNDDDTAVVEVTLRGPTLRFSDAAHLVVVTRAHDGVDVELDGHPAGSGVVVPVASGQTLRIGEITQGLRAYVAVGGGFEGPLVVGSRSTDVLTGIGHGPLRAGDRLDLGPPSRPHGTLSEPAGSAPPAGGHRLRVLAGPHPFSATAWAGLCARSWTVGTESNRIGIRLERDEEPIGSLRPTVTSTPMVTGAVQLPPDGDPIILMPDHATTGGYPIIGCVITADLPLLGQLRPGDTIQLVAVDRMEADRAWASAERQLGVRVSGWFPTVAGT